LGYAFIDSPLAGLAPIVGIYGVTAAAVLVASALWILLMRHTTRAHRYAAAVVLLGIFVLPMVFARITWTHPAGAPISVAIAQGAVPQDLKWQENNHAATLEKYTRLTRSALGTRLIVWPEAALPILANDLGEYLDMIKTEARARRSDLIVGLLRYDPNTDRYHNGMLVMSDADGWYYKRHLVPFGEYFPVPTFVRSWMRLMSLPFTDMSPGERDQPILRAAGQPLGLTICYEDAYGSEQLAVLKSATLLVNVTNNAWYGDSTAPHQHLEISRFRALEAGRYLIRAANDGISAVIGPDGKVTTQVPQFKEALLRSEVVPRAGLTPYARIGNYPVIGLALLALAWAWRSARRGAKF
jgi:apolipoprotein N-acyltransferase